VRKNVVQKILLYIVIACPSGLENRWAIALPIAQLVERRIVVVLDTKREELDAPRAILSHVFP